VTARILVVADEPDPRAILPRFPHRLGLASGRGAGRTGRRGERTLAGPDLIFMDMQLPVMDGCEAMRQIEADALPANTDHRREFIRNDGMMRKERTPAVTATSRNPTLATQLLRHSRRSGRHWMSDPARRS
jgi:CheY-like chemotaxis protein